MTKAQKREEALIDLMFEVLVCTGSKAAERYLNKDFEKATGKRVKKLKI